jgi:hypothetical protein
METQQEQRAVGARVTSGIAATVMAFVVILGLVCAVELALPRQGPEFLPPPTNPWMLVGVLIAALLVAWRYAEKARAWGRSLIIAAVGLALVVAGALYVDGKQNEAAFQAAMHSDETNSAYFLSEGRQACDWLASKHWGPPKGFDSLTQNPIRMGVARRALEYSTAVEYKEYITTPTAPSNGYIVINAWYHLCPFQQWVHLPRSGLVDDD